MVLGVVFVRCEVELEARMINLQAMIDRVLSWVQFSQSYWSLEWPLSGMVTAFLAVGVGVVLAFWGARLLRMFYVMGFMAAGAAAGVYLAGELEVDPLIGFVLGAGVLGLLGHLLFRWWVALTAGLCAVVVVSLVGGPWLADRAEGLADRLSERATGQPYFEQATTRSAPAVAVFEAMPTSTASADSGEGERPTPLGFLVALGKTVWAEHQPYAKRLAFGAAAAAVLAVLLGLFLPRLTMILGTSLVGVLAITVGGAVVLEGMAPSFWEGLCKHMSWMWAGVALVLLVSVTFQARSGRVREVAAAVPTATSS
jgi:hypothetical protein